MGHPREGLGGVNVLRVHFQKVSSPPLPSLLSHPLPAKCLPISGLFREITLWM